MPTLNAEHIKNEPKVFTFTDFPQECVAGCCCSAFPLTQSPLYAHPRFPWQRLREETQQNLFTLCHSELYIGNCPFCLEQLCFVFSHYSTSVNAMLARLRQEAGESMASLSYIARCASKKLIIIISVK